MEQQLIRFPQFIIIIAVLNDQKAAASWELSLEQICRVIKPRRE